METNSNQTAAAGVYPQTCPTCFVCKKQMADDRWFCRLTRNVTETPAPQAAKILLCSPRCVLSYFGESQPNGSGVEPDPDGFEHSPYVLAGGPGAESSKAVGAQTKRED